jgi:hypothetical protein
MCGHAVLVRGDHGALLSSDERAFVVAVGALFGYSFCRGLTSRFGVGRVASSGWQTVWSWWRSCEVATVHVLAMQTEGVLRFPEPCGGGEGIRGQVSPLTVTAVLTSGKTAVR